MKIYRSRKYKKEANSTKRLVSYGIISLIILLVFSIWGITLLANLSNIWDTLRGSPVSAPAGDSTAPPPPTLNSLAQYTSSPKVTISGSTESGATVTLYKTGVELDKQLVGNDGQFSFKNIILKEGSNSFTARSLDGAGNESEDSRAVEITLDTVAPKITLTEPTEGSTSSSQYVNVAGKTDPRATVTVNDQQQIVSPDGSFSGTVTLTTPGSNTIVVVATDLAGNQTKITRTVTYSP